MLPQPASLIGSALDIIFPRRCVGCGREGEFICPQCRKTINRILAPVCPLCGRPQPAGVLCSSCINWRASIDGIRSPFRFNGVIREAIHQFKYNNLRAIAGLLGGYLDVYLKHYPIACDVIVPVPLHHRRLRERGYNQAVLLAKKLNELIRVPVSENCLVRSKYSSSQAKTASVKERLKNIHGAFSAGDELRGKHVLLIDDVCTSGSTLNECAGALKRGGVDSVWGLTVAREV